MLGNKDLIPVFRGEHGAGVKAHAQGGDMGSERNHRSREFAAGMFARRTQDPKSFPHGNRDSQSAARPSPHD